MFEKHRTKEIGVQIVGSLYPDSTRIHMLPIKDKSLSLSLSLSLYTRFQRKKHHKYNALKVTGVSVLKSKLSAVIKPGTMLEQKN
jgi:hypothetical protein